MKKKILLKTLMPLTTVGISLGIALPSISCSCGSNDDEQKQYKMDGTNWKGYISGRLTCEVNVGTDTVVIKEQSSYVANNWVIPDTVTDEIGNAYKVIAIDDGVFYDGSLSGSLLIGNNVTIIGDNAFESMSTLNGTLTFGTSVTSIGYAAFGYADFDYIVSNFDNLPDVGDYAFDEWKDTGYHTVANSGRCSVNALLTLFKDKGLSDNWLAA